MKAEFATQAAHSTAQAMTPGWWSYAQSAVQAIENDKCHMGIYSGLRTAVGAAIKAQGYKPPPHELAELWIEKNKGVTK